MLNASMRDLNIRREYLSLDTSPQGAHHDRPSYQYLWPLMAVQTEELRPVMVGIDYFKQLNTSWGQIMAYASMITAPVLVLYIAFQRSFINSIASSGVKG